VAAETAPRQRAAPRAAAPLGLPKPWLAQVAVVVPAAMQAAPRRVPQAPALELPWLWAARQT
jgi:hypothetical protein